MHGKFQVNQYLISEIKERVSIQPLPPTEKEGVEKYHLRERVKEAYSKDLFLYPNKYQFYLLRDFA